MEWMEKLVFFATIYPQCNISEKQQCHAAHSEQRMSRCNRGERHVWRLCECCLQPGRAGETGRVSVRLSCPQELVKIPGPQGPVWLAHKGRLCVLGPRYEALPACQVPGDGMRDGKAGQGETHTALSVSSCTVCRGLFSGDADGSQLLNPNPPPPPPPPPLPPSRRNIVSF